MKDAFERMPEAFLDWLDECPTPQWSDVQFVQIKVTENSVHYSFPAPDEDYEEEDNEE